MKSTSLASVYKRQIKAEISAHKKDLRAIAKANKTERAQINKDLKKLTLQETRLNKAEASELAAINRRIAILQGRL
jgi:hypothetical protein